MELSTAEARRLQEIVEVLAARATTYSHALPHGRGQRDLKARNESLDLFRIEALRILAGQGVIR